MAETNGASSTVTLDREKLREQFGADAAIADFGDPIPMAVRCAAEDAIAAGAIAVPDGVAMILEPILSSDQQVIVALRPKPGATPQRHHDDGLFTDERMLSSWRIDVAELIPEEGDDGFDELAATLEAVCASANALLPHYRALLVGEQRAGTPLTLIRYQTRSLALSDPHAGLALVAALNRSAGGAVPGGPFWWSTVLSEDGVVKVREVCDDAAIPVPPAVVTSLLRTHGGPLWMTLPRPQAVAASLWTLKSPDPAVVELELRGEILNVTQGDDGASFDRNGGEVDYCARRGDEVQIAFPLEASELTIQVDDATRTSNTQVTLTARD